MNVPVENIIFLSDSRRHNFQLKENTTIVRLLIKPADSHLRIFTHGPIHVRIITRYLATEKLNLDDLVQIQGEIGAKIDYDCFGIVTVNAEKTAKFTLDLHSNFSEGHEKEEVLLLGRPKKCSSSPIILCDQPTASGSHGVTFGEIPDAELKYLMSRGLSETEAKKLLIRSRFAEAFKLAKKSEKFDNSLEAKFNELLEEILP